LQRAGWTLAALGLIEAGWLRLGDRYYQALAQPGSRKLGLLIGINQYQKTPALAGCLTDVELQRELLIHRFGFHPSDILTLTDEQASREQIEAAFLKHLTEQAQPGDVVVFHFSGYGRRVKLETSPEAVLNSLVTVDGVVSTSDVPAVNDLLEETLWLLLRSLPTDRVTTVLDTSYNAYSTLLQGNLRIRARPQLAQGQLSTQAQEFQAKLLTRQGDIASDRPLPGVVLTAAGSNQQASEAQWPGFSAGLFTYALTQYLWEVTQPTTVQVSLSRVAEVVEQLGGKQQPTLSGDKSQQSELTYDLSPDTSVGADGVMVAVEDDGKTAQVWLAGLPPSVLEYYAVNSRLRVVTPIVSGEQVELSSIQLQVRSRTGLTAKAQICGNDSTGSLQVGQLVQEAVRVLPRNIGLTIALDASLERIERVDATSAFAAIRHVSTVIAGEQSADYLFGRVREANASGSSSRSRYGLFSPGSELIPNTAGEAGEAVKLAVQRLVPKLQTLLAAKLWRLTTNEGSSRLGVRATLEIMVPQEQVLMQRETRRSRSRVFAGESPKSESVTLAPERPLASEGNIPTVLIGSRIQYRVDNQSDRPVYLMLLGLDSSKKAIALYHPEPAQETNGSETKPSLKDLVIAPGETLSVPETSVDFESVIHGPAGLAETQLIFSYAPFTQTLAALGATTRPRDENEPIGPLLNPLEVAHAVLQDLHQANAVKADTGSVADTYALDVNIWASISFVYQVV